MLKIGINGFGRIGRMVLRAFIEKGMHKDGYSISCINDITDLDTNIHLLKYDSVHGMFPYSVEKTKDGVVIDGMVVKFVAEPEPSKLPWGDMGVDVVFECSGRFTKHADASKHLAAGAKKVIISAPSSDADITVVYGINHKDIKPEHKIISNGSCTTNCLAPVAYVLDKNFGIERGFMTTIHSYTADQRLIDTAHKDKRRARSAAMSMIPTTTGAAKAIGLVLPNLKGKLDGTSIRVPTPNVSLVDFKLNTKKPASIEEINALMKEAANGELKGILRYTEEELVSIDYNHDAHSSIFDATGTAVIEGTFVRVMSWYDNEFGFSNRMLDLCKYIF